MLQKLKELIEVALDDGESEERVFEAIDGMRLMYEGITGKTRESLKNIGVTVDGGLAISPSQAAYCLVYTPMRSVVFLRGIYKAILHSQVINPGFRVNIFYAGCGPYAALVTPFVALFGAEELGLYMLDINPESVDTARRLYEGLGAGDYVRAWVVDDATTCRLPEGETMHIVISETMQKALMEEPQMAIMMNLVPQMAADAVFVPEEIRVCLKLLGPEGVAMGNYTGSYEPECIELGDVCAIGRHNCLAPVPVTVQVPMNYGKFTALTLFTYIQVYGDECLDPYNSHLNAPVLVDEVDGKPGVRVTLRYEMGNVPGFRHEWEAYSFPKRERPKRVFIGER